MLNNAEGLYQRLQGPPFQPPVIRKRLDPECGGCAELWLRHLQVVNFL